MLDFKFGHFLLNEFFIGVINQMDLTEEWDRTTSIDVHLTPLILTIDCIIQTRLSKHLYSPLFVFGVFYAFPKPGISKIRRSLRFLRYNNMIIIIYSPLDVFEYLYMSKCVDVLWASLVAQW